jgi:hypothetical protein
MLGIRITGTNISIERVRVFDSMSLQCRSPFVNHVRDAEYRKMGIFTPCDWKVVGKPLSDRGHCEHVLYIDG